MGNPATAVLWESWRLSRLSLAFAMLLATMGGTLLIVLPLPGEMGVTLTVPWLIYLAWFSQFWALKTDNLKGFALRVGFSRPIRTWVLVAVPMAYIAVSSAIAYVVPALVLRTAFGIPFPHFPVAALVSTLCLTLVAFSWSSANSGRRRIVVAFLWLLGMNWFLNALAAIGESATSGLTDLLSYSAAAYVWMGIFSAASFWIAITGAARQRRGDGPNSAAQKSEGNATARKRPGLIGPIAGRFRAPCPTSSPIRAQLWFEMSTVGGRVLKVGVLAAVLAPIFFTILDANRALGLEVYFWVWFPLMAPVFVALPLMLGITRNQGTSHLGAFAATRSLGTGHLVGLKALVTSLSILLSWGALIGVLWVFAVWLGVWGPETRAGSIEYFGDFFPPPSTVTDVLRTAFTFVLPFSALVVGAGALHAFWVLNARRVVLVGTAVGIYIALWVLVGVRGWVDGSAIATVHLWIAALAVSIGTAFLFRTWIVGRLCTWRSLSGVLAIGLIFLVMTLWLNPNPDDIEDHLSAYLLGSLPLILMALLPWSFSRLRHR